MTNALRMSLASWLSLAIVAGQVCKTSLAAEPNAVTITRTKLEVTRRYVRLADEIANNSDRNVWILTGSDTCDVSAGISVTEGDRSVLARERLDISVVHLRQPRPQRWLRPAQRWYRQIHTYRSRTRRPPLGVGAHRL